jgi:hypothetical protein
MVDVPESDVWTNCLCLFRLKGVRGVGMITL